MNLIASKLSSRLRQALKAKGMTIEELAEKSGISLSGLKKWLGGRASPRTDNLQKVADALEVTVDWLLAVNDVPVRAVGAAEGTDLPLLDGQRRLMAIQAKSRLTKTVEINRLVEAYEEALSRAKGTTPDAYQLMELTLMLYDAATVAEEAVSQALGKGKERSAPD